MNIYEQLNKINDAESLSEKYNVRNTKGLKKLRESSIEAPNLNTITKTLLDAFPVLQDEENYTEAKEISKTIYNILMYNYRVAQYEESERLEQEERAKRRAEIAANPESSVLRKLKKAFPDFDLK